MTIILTRVDNRLVHGQVLAAWVPALEVDSILVLDDEAARNPLIRGAMEIAIPPDVQFEVSPVADVATAMAHLRGAERTLVLLRDVNDASRAVEAGLPLTRLNLGNVHMALGRRTVTQAVSLSPAEIASLELLAAKGVTVELKTLPRDVAVPLAELKQRVEAEPRA